MESQEFLHPAEIARYRGGLRSPAKPLLDNGYRLDGDSDGIRTLIKAAVCLIVIRYPAVEELDIVVIEARRKLDLNAGWIAALAHQADSHFLTVMLVQFRSTCIHVLHIAIGRQDADCAHAHYQNGHGEICVDAQVAVKHVVNPRFPCFLNVPGKDPCRYRKQESTPGQMRWCGAL